MPRFGIPYVGCAIQISALCMDKSLCYLVARDAGIATSGRASCSTRQGLQGCYPARTKARILAELDLYRPGVNPTAHLDPLVAAYGACQPGHLTP